MNATSQAAVGLQLIEPGQRVTVRVPATTANLGPGYDSLGMALALHDTLTVESLDTDELVFDLRGEGADTLPRDASHLVIRAMDAAFERLGFRHGGLKVTAQNVNPHGRGLGSSASAVVAAVSAANAMVPAESRRGRDWILQLTSEMEGHPDNVAPAIYGGLALSWQDSDQYSSTRAEVAGAVIPIVAVPDFELSTEAARALLPASVGHHAAAMNSGRAALLIHALTRDPGFLLAGTEDYLHQSYRASAMRPSAALITALRRAGHAAVVSGAGPTVLVLANGEPEAADILAFIDAFTGSNTPEVNWRVLKLAVDVEGAKVDVHRR
ncbi:homoserine kinase [Pseudarthrobacter chlorophenolicus A6]|uniref:Homoserine kinase n=1 Tax=Pseudarthrobacter chlorophenolicus (strain ATCC 700700 / DSM 12829 / CIP 107037 / JCM 12360 / KCTC 9906 / NCIMB 13794 / A6) TaxID=452863 RepID=B8HB05_PSECP|nr:homoserine kinase [Pseudarthrobacter chlorophenolicus]ACL40319.1 homoserine kinase [Pseudarthrobacter chlorophenolicus A6]SDQ83708.1 homoserine kinase [Pseudarthrobacter chlorophenolicus]